MIKDTFIIRSEWWDAISELDAMQKSNILDNLFYFHLGEHDKIILDCLPVKLVWKLIEPNLTRNVAAYDLRKITSAENGKKGGRPPKENNLNNLNKPIAETYKPKETLSVSVSDSDSDSVSVNDTDIDTEFKKFNYKTSLINLIQDKNLVNDYMLIRKTKRAANTESALNLLIEECKKHNIKIIDAVKIMIERNWIGFKFSWLKNDNQAIISLKPKKHGEITI